MMENNMGSSDKNNNSNSQGFSGSRYNQGNVNSMGNNNSNKKSDLKNENTGNQRRNSDADRRNSTIGSTRRPERSAQRRRPPSGEQRRRPPRSAQRRRPLRERDREHRMMRDDKVNPDRMRRVNASRSRTGKTKFNPKESLRNIKEVGVAESVKNLFNRSKKNNDGYNDSYNDNYDGKRPLRRNEMDAKPKKKGKKILKYISLGFTIFALLFAIAGVIYVVPIAKEMKKKVADKVEEGFTSSKIVVQDANGNEIKGVFNQKQESLKKDEVGKNWDIMVHSVIDVEDRDFYKHSGINYKSLAGAIFSGFQTGGDFTKRGGSTITQQLVKLYVLQDYNKTFNRKIKEAVGAIEFEKQVGKDLSKEETKQKILELYFSNTSYGNNIIGIKAAAKEYFDKNLDELQPEQLIYLSTIPNRPESYNPYGETEEQKQDSDYINEATRKRMDKTVLDCMITCGTISKEQADEYRGKIEEIENAIKERKQARNNGEDDKASVYVRSYVKDAAYEYFAKTSRGIDKPYKSHYKDQKEYSKALMDYENVKNDLSAQITHNTKDIVIKTTIDMDKQEELQDSVNNRLDQITGKKKNRTLLDVKYDKNGDKLNEEEEDVLDNYIKETNINDRQSKKKDLIEKYKKDGFQKIIDSIKDKTGIVVGDQLIYDIQGSAACIKNEEGSAHVVAIVGGRNDVNDEVPEIDVNRATSEPHATGSSFKPVVVYGPGFENPATKEEKKLNPDSVLPYNKNLDEADEEFVEVKKGRGGKLPGDAGEYSGSSIKIEDAVGQSLNTIAFNVFHYLGKNYAKKNGIANAENGATQLAWTYLSKVNLTGMGPFDTDSGYNMALGEGESTKVTSLEMAGIYSAMERGGKYIAPTCIDSVEGWDYDSKSDSSKQLYEEDTCKRLNKVMKKVFSGGTASNFKISGKWGDEIAGKTGTTQYNHNVWLCGYSKEYTTAVWCGYSTDSWQNDPERGGRLSNESSGIWNKYMEAIHKDMKFDKSKDKLDDEPSNKDSDEFLKSKNWFEEKIDDIEEDLHGHDNDEHKTHDPNQHNNSWNNIPWGNGQNQNQPNNQDPNNQNDPNNQDPNRHGQDDQNKKKNPHGDGDQQSQGDNGGH